MLEFSERVQCSDLIGWGRAYTYKTSEKWVRGGGENDE